MGEDGGLGNRLEQAEADHRRRHAYGELGLGRQQAVTKLADLQLRPVQFDLAAVLQADGFVLVAQADLAFGSDAGHGAVLQLGAVYRLGDHALALQLVFLAGARR
ncbi:hypothetical protein D3C78_1488920 [compost metagenome]